MNTEKEIIQKLESLYPLVEDFQKELKSRQNEINWELFLAKNLGNTIKSRLEYLSKLKNEYECTTFYVGLNYEFGNKYKIKNFQKALLSYQQGAASYDYLSMFRMYSIYFNDYSKFNLKPNKVLEKIYLLKCFAYVPYSIFDYLRNLPMIDPITELINHLEIEEDDDVELTKIFEFLSLLEKTSKYKQIISKNDISLIRCCLQYKFMDIRDLTELEKLDKLGMLEATYKLACFIKDQEGEKNKILGLYQKLINKRFFKCCSDYGLFYFNVLSDYARASRIFHLGVENGNCECHSYVYNVSIYLMDFKSYENGIAAPTKKKLIDLLQYLIDSAISGNYYDIIEILDYIKIAKKLKFDADLNKKYHSYLKEISDFLININGEEKKIDKYFNNENAYFEFSRTLAMLYVEGLFDIVEKNPFKGMELLKIALSKVNSTSNKAYYYRIIYKIRKMFNQNHKDIISDEKLMKTEKKLFRYYQERLSESNLGHSYFYIFGTLYEKGIGTKIDEEKAYCFYKEAILWDKKNIYNSIISYYKKYKAGKKLLLNKYKDMEDLIEKLNNLNLVSQDDMKCFICFENDIDIYFMPCKHKICKVCYEHIKEENNCPFCRSKIIFVKFYDKTKK